jgi:hypothetical protein
VASNTTLNPGASGDVIATKERTHDGDATKVQVVTLAGVSGTEGSYTFGDIGGDATNGLDVDVTRVIPGTSATHLGKAEDAAHTSGDTGVAVLAVRRDTAAAGSGADGDYSTLNVNSSGRLYTSATVDAALPAGTNNIGDVDVLSVVPGTGATALGKAIDTAAGGTDTGVAALFVRDDALTTLTPVDGDYVPGRVDSTGALHVRVSAGGISGIADDAAFTVGTSETVPVGFLADETSPDSVDEGDMGAARMTLDRKQIVTPRPHTSGGLSIFRSLDLDETEEDIKTSAGQLYGYYFANTNASARYLKFYNATAANVTVGTTTPALTFYLPPTSAGHIEFTHGIAFSTAITAAATTGVADNDTGAPGANEVILNAFYV